MSIIKASIISCSLPPVLGPVKYNDNYYINTYLYMYVLCLDKKKPLKN